LALVHADLGCQFRLRHAQFAAPLADDLVQFHVLHHQQTPDQDSSGTDATHRKQDAAETMKPRSVDLG
jgi:hypothetical protein